MAKLTKEEFIKSLNEMSLLEIKELVDAMKEEYGVDPSAVAAAAPVAQVEEAAGPSTVTVTLTAAGEFKIRFNGEWKYSLGAGALADGQYHDNDANIAKEAGTYLIHVELGANAIANFIADQTIVAFTVSAAA